eukprot:10745128-Ditylum_brightwellii.AAC.1
MKGTMELSTNAAIISKIIREQDNEGDIAHSNSNSNTFKSAGCSHSQLRCCEFEGNSNIQKYVCVWKNIATTFLTIYAKSSTVQRII